MAGLEKLAALRGDWQATYKLRGDPSFECDTASKATVSPIVGGRFVRIDYTWDEEDFLKEHGPQLGSLLVGFEAEPEPGVATVAWVDGWHNGGRIMVSPGVLLESGGVDVRGSYPDKPEYAGWGWRTRLEPAGDGWTMTMWNVTPDGDEAEAVLADYRRAG
jgi:Protein of unknown function (DUF1579)